MATKTTQPDLDLLFEALGNKHRREIILALGLQPIAISDLAASRGLSLQAIHKHVNQLENAGLITRKKSGRITFLTLNRASIREVQHWLNQFQAHWDGGSETLENYARTIEFKKQLKLSKKEKK